MKLRSKYGGLAVVLIGVLAVVAWWASRAGSRPSGGGATRTAASVPSDAGGTVPRSEAPQPVDGEVDTRRVAAEFAVPAALDVHGRVVAERPFGSRLTHRRADTVRVVEAVEPGHFELEAVLPGDRLVVTDGRAAGSVLVTADHMDEGEVRVLADGGVSIQGRIELDTLLVPMPDVGLLLQLVGESTEAPPFSLAASGERPSGSGWFAGRSDAEGRFRFELLPHELARERVLYAGGNGVMGEASGVRLEAIDPEALVRVPVHPIAAARLVLIDAEGRRVRTEGRQVDVDVPEADPTRGRSATSLPARLLTAGLLPEGERPGWDLLLMESDSYGEGLGPFTVEVSVPGIGSGATRLSLDPLQVGLTTHEVGLGLPTDARAILEVALVDQTGAPVDPRLLGSGELLLSPDGGEPFFHYVPEGAGTNPIAVPELAPGSYGISFRSLRHDLRAPAAGQPLARVDVAGTRTRVELRTVVQRGAVLLRATDEAGRAVSGYLAVMVAPADGVTNGPDGSIRLAGVRPFTFDGAPYRLEGLAPGPYVLLGHSRPLSAGRPYVELEVPEQGEVELAVALGER